MLPIKVRTKKIQSNEFQLSQWRNNGKVTIEFQNISEMCSLCEARWRQLIKEKPETKVVLHSDLRCMHGNCVKKRDRFDLLNRRCFS